MGILDDENMAKLRALKNKMLGRDEHALVDDENKAKNMHYAGIKKVRPLVVEKIVKGKRYLEEQTVTKRFWKHREQNTAETQTQSSTPPNEFRFRDIFTPSKKEDIDLCIGLDVGTSTTKAVIKEVYADNDAFYIVDFGKYGITGEEYLLPTYLCEKNGIFSLPEYGQPHTCTNLKLNFIRSEKNADIYFRAYIALVLRYIKSWFVKKHGRDDIVKNKNIIWQVNLGIPSVQFNNDGDNAKFLQVLKEAYYLSAFSDISAKSPVMEEDKTALNIVPEIIASIQSYIKRNDISHEGLYCVSDIGAGTLDICTFRVKEDAGNIIYSFFKSKVEPLGTKEYQSALFNYKNAFNSLVAQKERVIAAQSLDHIVTDEEDYLVVEEIKQCQHEDVAKYKNKILTSFKKVLFSTYRERDPHAREWRETVPLAIGGGGSAIAFYMNLIEEDLTAWLKKNCGDHFGYRRCRGFRLIDVKRNQKDFITENKNIDCARTAVAVGLSYSIDDFDDIKRYYKESEVDAITLDSSKDYEENYISKDQM